jgi:hypothetical protein
MGYIGQQFPKLCLGAPRRPALKPKPASTTSDLMAQTPDGAGKLLRRSHAIVTLGDSACELSETLDSTPLGAKCEIGPGGRYARQKYMYPDKQSAIHKGSGEFRQQPSRSVRGKTIGG